jgi:hypothetical protein
MTADVSLRTVAPRPTAVVSQTTTWEIYGHWREDPSELETEIYYLVQRPE